jgi:hypothetical protein
MDDIEHTYEGKDACWWAGNAAHWHGQAEEHAARASAVAGCNEALTDQLRGAVEERDRYREALVAIKRGDEPPQAIAALALKRRGLRGGR